MTRVADLIGADLALWVARAQKIPVYERDKDSWPGYCRINDERLKHPVITVGSIGDVHLKDLRGSVRYAPHEDWSQGGPLIEQHHITIDWNTSNDKDPTYDAEPWMSVISGNAIYYGPTLLIAAMRALVASVYGEDVPDLHNGTAGDVTA